MLLISRAMWAAAFALSANFAIAAHNGVVRVKSSYFTEIDQAALATAAGVRLRPSTLLVFGNPALGTLFITAKPEAGLDWPVRLLITQDETGEVWAVYTDFKWTAVRHGIRDRDAEFTTASRVIGSITSAVTGQ